MKKLFYPSFLLGLFCCLIFTEFSYAYSKKVSVTVGNSVTGFVYNTSREPVADIYVELQNDVYSTIQRIRTSGSGFFSFRNLKDGLYNVKVLPYNTNYQEQSRPVSLISISAIPGSGGISEQVDFYLFLKRDGSVGPLAAPGVIFAQSVPSEAEKYYEKGIKFLGDKNETEGFENLKKALEIFPDYFLALDRLGTEYIVREYNRAAYVLLTKALEVNPKSFSSTFGLGLAQYRLQEYDKAVENLKKASVLYSESANAHLWLGIAHQQNKNLSEAEASLLKANKLYNEKSADVHWQLARLYAEQKRYTEALAEMQLFVKYNPKAKDDEKIQQAIEKLKEKAAIK